MTMDLKGTLPADTLAHYACVCTRVRSYHQPCNFIVRCHILHTYIHTWTPRSDIRMFNIDYLEHETNFKVEGLLIICMHDIFVSKSGIIFIL